MEKRTKDNPWKLKTPPGTAEYTMYIATIRKGKAHYLLGLKANQPELLEEVELAFIHHKASSRDQQDTKGHGRVETRICEVIDDPCSHKRTSGRI